MSEKHSDWSNQRPNILQVATTFCIQKVLRRTIENGNSHKLSLNTVKGSIDFNLFIMLMYYLIFCMDILIDNHLIIFLKCVKYNRMTLYHENNMH